MIFLYAGLLILFLALWIIAKLSKLPIPQVENNYSKPFLASAVLLHRWARQFGALLPGGRTGSGQLAKKRKLSNQLQTIYPGETAETQLYRYTVERTSTMILILFIGLLAACVITFMAVENTVLEEGDFIKRNDQGGSDMDVNLTAGIIGEEDLDNEIKIVVPARVYSREETDNLFDELDKNIDQILLKENDSFDHITKSMDLAKSVEGYPFSISWELSSYDYMDADGKISNGDLEMPVIVTLTGDCLYEKEHRYLVRNIRICPEELTRKEEIIKEIQETVSDINEKTASEYELPLPDEISFGRLQWSEKTENDSLLVLALAMAVSICVIPMKEAEVNGKLKKRSKELLIDYPAFVSKLTLYIGAGMSVRNSFIRMGHEYGKAMERRSEKSFIGTELIITAHELETGISEYEAYESFGKRCGTREYMRFSALLTQNIRKGSTDLIRLLKEESGDAFELRKNEAKKLGEEASTKLLLPMVMMLAVVMVIIMVPAYMSFSA